MINTSGVHCNSLALLLIYYEWNGDAGTRKIPEVVSANSR